MTLSACLIVTLTLLQHFKLCELGTRSRNAPSQATDQGLDVPND